MSKLSKEIITTIINNCAIRTKLPKDKVEARILYLLTDVEDKIEEIENVIIKEIGYGRKAKK